MKKIQLRFLSLFFLLSLACAAAVQAQPGGPPLGSGPWVMKSFEQDYIKVSVVARGLDHPFGMVFLPETVTSANSLGDVLLAERTGKVKLLKNGQLQTETVADLKTVFPMEQLFDLKLHPQFTDNGLIYFTYIKTAPNPDGSDKYWVTTALGRGRFDGVHLVDLEDVYVAEAWSSNIGGASSRMHFLQDGTLLLGVSHRIDLEAPQQLSSHIGKILRLNDDGSVPKDNPFIGVEGALPEIYAWGIRSAMDFVTHPVTGEVWEIENGPQGGDEVNIIRPGVNYGWPIATFGRDYDGDRFSPQPWVEGIELPEVFWVPSITVAGMNFYTGAKFPNWKNNLFVTSMIRGRIPGTGHLQRVVFNDKGEIRREMLLTELHQRIRYVQQGPDELLYLLTDENDGALLSIEPATEQEFIDAAAAAGNEIPVSQVEQPDPLNDAPLFANQDCRACHRTNVNLVGPSYVNIARRYEATNDNLDFLTNRIIEGGEGVWGETPMTPHPDLDPAIARELASNILSLETE
ncbi:MAG: PQQ-dependent sugar dehydrogenase [Pseudomonadota bacterium]